MDVSRNLSRALRVPTGWLRPHLTDPAIVRADHAQAAAADETARIRADHLRALDQLTTASNARVTALEETRDALRIRAERAEADLDAARTQSQLLAERLAQATIGEADQAPADASPTQPCTPGRARKTPQASHPEA